MQRKAPMPNFEWRRCKPHPRMVETATLKDVP